MRLRLAPLLLALACDGPVLVYFPVEPVCPAMGCHLELGFEQTTGMLVVGSLMPGECVTAPALEASALRSRWLHAPTLGWSAPPVMSTRSAAACATIHAP